MKASDILEGIDTSKHPMAEQLAEEVLWMADRLTANRAAIGNAPIVIPYDNGGGQTGVRRNPAFDAYESLVNSFVRALTALDDILADSPAAKTSGDALSQLRLIVGQRKAV